MRILYGVVGEGMGHAMRSRVVLESLVERGHEVEVMASGRAVDFLSRRFDDVNRIHGLHMIMEENRVRKGKTLWSNVIKGAAGLPGNIAAYFDLIDGFEPELVISDFESWTYFYAKAHGLPVLSIDNMQIINRCRHSAEVLAGDRTNFEITRAFVKSKLPFCDHYMIATFFHPPIKARCRANTSLFPPILRPEILAAERSRGDHLLVYQAAEGHEALTEALAQLGIECRVYGMRRDLREEQVEGMLRYRPFSEHRFIADLASARGVVAGGGFTLMGEAVYLRKPMLAVPIRGQFEQVLNARYLESAGYGLGAPEVDADTLGEFLDGLPAREHQLAGYEQDGNELLLAALDEHLDRAAAGLY